LRIGDADKTDGQGNGFPDDGFAVVHLRKEINGKTSRLDG
jgi:hypothetical protein